VRSELTQKLRDRVQRTLNAAHIRPARTEVRDHRVEIRLRNSADLVASHDALLPLAEPLGGILSGRDQRTVEISPEGSDTIALAPSQAAIDLRVHGAVEESLPIVERRINELGTVEPTVESEGNDRIVVEVPGLQDPTRLEALLGQTAKLTFQLSTSRWAPNQL